jgi:hypothetical protein
LSSLIVYTLGLKVLRSVTENEDNDLIVIWGYSDYCERGKGREIRPCRKDCPVPTERATRAGLASDWLTTSRQWIIWEKLGAIRSPWTILFPTMSLFNGFIILPVYSETHLIYDQYSELLDTEGNGSRIHMRTPWIPTLPKLQSWKHKVTSRGSDATFTNDFDCWAYIVVENFGQIGQKYWSRLCKILNPWLYSDEDEEFRSFDSWKRSQVKRQERVSVQSDTGEQEISVSPPRCMMDHMPPDSHFRVQNYQQWVILSLRFLALFEEGKRWSDHRKSEQSKALLWPLIWPDYVEKWTVSLHWAWELCLSRIMLKRRKP